LNVIVGFTRHCGPTIVAFADGLCEDPPPEPSMKPFPPSPKDCTVTVTDPGEEYVRSTQAEMLVSLLLDIP
jgi:hypothetical protein